MTGEGRRTPTRDCGRKCEAPKSRFVHFVWSFFLKMEICSLTLSLEEPPNGFFHVQTVSLLPMKPKIQSKTFVCHTLDNLSIRQQTGYDNIKQTFVNRACKQLFHFEKPTHANYPRANHALLHTLKPTTTCGNHTMPLLTTFHHTWL